MILAILLVLAAPSADFEAYMLDHETACAGPFDKMARPQTLEIGAGAFKITLDGYTARIDRAGGAPVAGEVRLGVLSSIKDFEEETKQNLDQFLSFFKANKVELILVGGDTAFGETEVTDVFSHLAKSGLPVLGVAGNAESRSGFNRALKDTWAEHKNVINMGLVRRVDFPGVDVISLPGYYDKKFVHQTGACVYKPEDAEGLATLAKEAGEDPVVLLTHGPPKQDGKGAVDYVPGVGNVGDPQITEVLKKAGIPFGIFGHIMEAGGRGTDLSGKKEVKPGTFAAQLYLNPGPANSLPWRMNFGADSFGMAAVLTVKGKQAKFEILRAPQRIKPE
jgi:Icc-related predicted phosphoesterase